jgi:hypothetical protein
MMLHFISWILNKAWFYVKIVHILSLSLSLFHRSLVVESLNWFCLYDIMAIGPLI